LDENFYKLVDGKSTKEARRYLYQAILARGLAKEERKVEAGS
jgi:hypothetical protein